MSTRITNNMVARNVLADLQDVADRLSRTQRIMSSGKQITRPSDDPYGATRAVELRSELAGVQQYQRNIAEASSWQQVTESALSTIGDSIQRVRELVISGSNDAGGPAARVAAANEIDQLIEAIKAAGNATYAGRYVFAGTQTQTKPWGGGAAGDAYQGDTNPIAREIGPGVSVTVNVDLSSILGSGTGAADGRLLDVLRTISQDLRTGTSASLDALRTTDLQGLDANFNDLLQLRAQVGALGNRLDAAGTRLQQVEETSTKLLSDTEDADMAKTLVSFSTQQAVYQSALRAGANIVQASLLDFLK